MAHLMSSADRMELENIFMRIVTRNAMPSEKVGTLRRAFMDAAIDVAWEEARKRADARARAHDGNNIRHCQFCATELDVEQGEVVVLKAEIADYERVEQKIMKIVRDNDRQGIYDMLLPIHYREEDV